MKFTIHKILFCFLISFTFSCNSSKKDAKLKNIISDKAKISDSLTLDDIQGKLFFSQPTNDPKFCDLSKIIETDCWLGYFYFNDNNKVTFTFECVGDTSIVYFLGTYKQDKNTVKCHFDYSYECFFDTTGNSFKGKGKLVKEKDLFGIEILNSDCTNIYGYESVSENQKDYYVLSKAKQEKHKIFWNFFRQSKVGKAYF